MSVKNLQTMLFGFVETVTSACLSSYLRFMKTDCPLRGIIMGRRHMI